MLWLRGVDYTHLSRIASTIHALLVILAPLDELGIPLSYTVLMSLFPHELPALQRSEFLRRLVGIRPTTHPRTRICKRKFSVDSKLGQSGKGFDSPDSSVEIDFPTETLTLGVTPFSGDEVAREPKDHSVRWSQFFRPQHPYFGFAPCVVVFGSRRQKLLQCLFTSPHFTIYSCRRVLLVLLTLITLIRNQ